MLIQKAENLPVDQDAPLGQTARREMTRSMRLLLIPVVLLAIFLLVAVALTSYASQKSYSLMEEKRQVQQLQRENEELLVDISKMETPARIYDTATKQLGMVAPSRVLYAPNKSAGRQ